LENCPKESGGKNHGDRFLDEKNQGDRFLNEFGEFIQKPVPLILMNYEL
jgi:hypothetical protein